MIRYIDEHKDQFGVEAICRVLRPAVRGFITSRGYRAAKTRPPSARSLKDELLVPEILRLHGENYGVYGVRKMHALMRRQGWEVGRDQTARLMGIAGVQGVKRSKKVFTTKSDPAAVKPADLVQRRFQAPAPRRLWVADITYVATWSGFAYVAFVTDEPLATCSHRSPTCSTRRTWLTWPTSSARMSLPWSWSMKTAAWRPPPRTWQPKAAACCGPEACTPMNSSMRSSRRRRHEPWACCAPRHAPAWPLTWSVMFHVVGNVQRRQHQRWAAQDAAAAPSAPAPPAPPAPAPPAPPAAASALSSADVITQLQQLGQLRESGVLTEAEFETQKTRILAGG